MAYLKKHKADNNQLVVVFVYFFMIIEHASKNQFQQLRGDLVKYLDKRYNESGHLEAEEQERLKEKIEVHKKLVEYYFDGSRPQVEGGWLKKVCSVLFTGRQQSTIVKPLKELEEIQRSITGSESEFLLENQQ